MNSYHQRGAYDIGGSEGGEGAYYGAAGIMFLFFIIGCGYVILRLFGVLP